MMAARAGVVVTALRHGLGSAGSSIRDCQQASESLALDSRVVDVSRIFPPASVCQRCHQACFSAMERAL